MFRKLLPLIVLFTSLNGSPSQAATKGKVLVVVSSQASLTLRNGKSYPTGFYLNELTVPVRALVQNGYEVVFANPLGNRPVLDSHSDSPKYFGGSAALHQQYRQFLNQLEGLKRPARLSDVIRSGLGQFAGVFFPGGHAPMIDLLRDPAVHVVLHHFHSRLKPTALICHGPISLLAALPRAPLFVDALASGDKERAKSFNQGWIYAGYRMTSFSTSEEKVAEAGQLGGQVLFYPDEALSLAGGALRIAPPWKSNVVQDHELITGQNPFSDEELAMTFLKALDGNRTH